jgi:hypothetical protein
MSIVGAVSSSIGRYFLAKFSHKIVPQFLSEFANKNVDFIGKKISGSSLKATVFSFIWAISPVASNPLFIAVGIAKARLRWILLGFFSGRLLSYFSLSYAARIIYENFESMFVNEVFDLRKLFMNFFGIGGIFAYLMFDWEYFIVKRKIRFNKNIFKKFKKKNVTVNT